VSTCIREKKPATYKYIFGPVPSRRLGRSLGVDLVPLKTCTFDCVFCEVGVTTLNTLDRREYAPANTIVAELRDWIKSGGKADYITLAGSGEPTLHTGFGVILDKIRGLCSIRTALLTNGSLLNLPEVRRAASKADVVKVSLSAWNQTSFKKVNRPNPGVTFETLLTGLRTFRAGFKGELWLEVVAIAGYNDSVSAMKKIARLAESFRPDLIHLNTVVRPPAEAVSGVSRGRLERFADLFTPRAEIVGEMNTGTRRGRSAESHEIVAMLRRRPCTIADIAAGLGLRKKDASTAIALLLSGGMVRTLKRGTKVYYVSG
jgi:wyosine [tRNA(Phe)-imidazoG37] synthetase (radical SAM superfamily)